MGWQKRGSGRKYDSMSGVGTMIGHYTQKIINCGIRSKTCRTCTYWSNKNVVPPEHDCSKNFLGTSKAMEADVGATLVKNIENASDKAVVRTMVTDEDCTTIARIRAEAGHEVEKWSDLNHLKNCVTNAIWKLNKKFPKDLCTENISYLVRCFSYGVRQNKGDPVKLKDAILNIVPHAFGDHHSCGQWCGHVKNPDSYKHKTLSADFTNESLREELTKTFKVFAENAEKIARCASTKDNENFNHMIASKAPKSRHYSSSKSLEARVLCAASQKNMGHDYVCDLNKSMGVSPGKMTEVQALRTARKRKRTLDMKNTQSYKRKRLLAKQTNKRKEQTASIKEGVTYKSGVDLLPQADITEIPDITYPPIKETVKFDINTKFSKVYFDLETTSFTPNCDITQIAAICDGTSFNQYITPDKKINKIASEITGITYRDGVLRYFGKPVPSVPINTGLESFLSWLSKLPKPILLIAHNGERFDSRRLSRKILQCDMQKSFCDMVEGYVDTLPYFRQNYPQLEKHKQDFLVQTLLGQEYGAHNAFEDVKALKKLVESSYVLDTFIHDKEVTARMETYNDMIKAKVISSEMVKRMATSGLCYGHLLLAHSRDENRRGIELLFREKNNQGQARVTAKSRIIKTVSNYLEEKSRCSSQSS